MTIIITIRNCGNFDEQIYRPREATIKGLSLEEVVDLAVKKFYGKKAFFWQDNGLKDQGIYGQICEPLPAKLGGGNTCLTGRVRIDIVNTAF